MNNWDINIFNYIFFQPAFFWLFLIIPFFGYLKYIQFKKKERQLFISQHFDEENSSQFNVYFLLRIFLNILRVFIIALIIFILAKPFKWSDVEDVYADYDWGIDIVLALDVSLSMQSRDFNPNRLEAAKRVVQQFIDQRKGDRIGLVAYAGEAYTVCSPTTNYSLIKNRLNDLNGADIEQGTAIGLGLGTSVLQLQSETTKSKVIILLTDGMNNSGELSPISAAELAKENDISVYTIGVGSNGEALSPVSTNFGIQYTMQKVEIDEETLKEISSITNGYYYRATDEQSLIEIYKNIDSLEKNKLLSSSEDNISPTTPTPFLNWLLVSTVLLFGIQMYLFPFNFKDS